jgi:hypothetical protein
MDLAKREGQTPDDSFPGPESVPFHPDEVGMIYELWTIWTATEKRYLPSQLMPELMSGYGRILTGLFDMDALYDKAKRQLKSQMPNANR